MPNKTKIAVNIITTTLTLFITAGVGFFLTPFIVKTLGVEAQGFAQLCANFVSYVGVVTIALDSMSGRFISVAVHKNELEDARKYYTSVFYGNIFLFAALSIPLALFIIHADRLIQIPYNLITDMRTLLTLSFFSFFTWNTLSLWYSVFYIRDLVYWRSIGNCFYSLLSATVVLVLFSLLPPKIWYTGLSEIIALCFAAAWGLYFKRRFLPDLQVKKAFFSLTHLKEVISSGIWLSLESTGELLLNGLDLLICNLMIDAKTMGVLALSKVLPQFIRRLNWSIATTFAPRLIITYASDNVTGMQKEIKHAAKINIYLSTIPLAGLMVFSKDFFTLWLPGQNAGLLQILSILACFPMAFLSGVPPCCNVFTAVNKTKQPAIYTMVCGLVSTMMVLILLRFTHLGVYAVAGTSSIVWLLGDLVYTVPAAARYLDLKWHTFFYVFGYSMAGTAITAIIGLGVKAALPTDTWVWLIAGCLLTGIVAFIVNILVIFDSNERKVLTNGVINMMRRLYL